MDKLGKIRTSQLNSTIDYASLKLELEDALRADQMYRLRNDAKLRAVDQNVPTYEGFRQMVNAAHLRPLQRDDYSFKAKEGSFWNPIAANDRPKSATNCNSIVQNRNERADVKQIENPNIVTCDQFTGALKTIRGHDAKFRYLESNKDLFVEKIFRREIPSPLFAEVMDVCFQAAATMDNVENIVKILSVMSRCNRFSLTISFMEEKERTTCTRLFDCLIERARERYHLLVDEIESLRITYGLESRQTESSILKFSVDRSMDR